MYLCCRKIDNVSTLSTFLQLGYTQYKINEFLCRPLQRITLSMFGVWNLYETCTELVRKLVKFCTNLHTLNFLAFKYKDPFTPNLNRHTVILTCSATHNTKHHPIITAAAASSAAASAPGNHHHLHFCPANPSPTMSTMSTMRDDRVCVNLSSS